jgi:hypothetical protein
LVTQLSFAGFRFRILLCLTLGKEVPPELSVMSGNPLDARDRELIAELDALSPSLLFIQPKTITSTLQNIAAGNVCFLALIGGEPAGCGAVKHCGELGEIKRMYVRSSARGNGNGGRSRGSSPSRAR